MTDRLRAGWWRPVRDVDRSRRSAPIDAVKPRASDSPVPFQALMAFTFILFVAPQTLVPVLAPLRIALLTAGLGIATHLFQAFKHRRAIPFPPEIRIAAGLVAWAIVTVPLSYWPGGSISFLLGVYLKSVAIFWLLSGVVNSLTRLRLVAWALTLMTVPMAATGLNNFISGQFLQGVDRIAGYEAALTGNPNGLALVLSLMLPLALALLQIARTTPIRTALLAVIVLDVTAVIVTFSRAGFLTIGTVMAMYLYRLLRRPERPWAIATLVLLLVCVPFLPSGYFHRLATIADIKSDPTGSAQSRWIDTLAATRLALTNPIVGVGIGQNNLALNEERGPSWQPVHNVYLQYAVDLGIPGILLFIVLLIRCLNNASFVRRRSVSVPALRDLFYLAEAIQTSLIAFAVGALFHPVGYEIHFYYFAGLAVAARAVYLAEGGNVVGARSSSGGIARFLAGHLEREEKRSPAAAVRNGPIAKPLDGHPPRKWMGQWGRPGAPARFEKGDRGDRLTRFCKR